MAINVRRLTRASPSSITFDKGNWDPFGTRALFNGDCSVVVLLRLKQVGVQQVIGDWANNGNTATSHSLHVNASNQLATYGNNGFGGTTKTSTFTLAVDTWYLVGFSRTNTNDTVYFHKYEYGGSWTHESGQTFCEFSNNDGHAFRLGDDQFGGGPTGALDAEVLIMGWAPSALSDAEWETLEDDGAALTDWFSLMGTVWRFNQALNTTDVLDLDTYIAHETAESNTTVVSVTEPTGWGEDAPAGLPPRGLNINQAVQRAAAW